MSNLFKNIHNPAIGRLITESKIGVMPTDTIYGLVCCASDQAAVARLYDIKQREAKPGTIIAANIDQLVILGIKRRYLTAVSQYWPGPVSVVVPVGGELDYLTQGARTLAVRLVNDSDIRELLESIGPLLTTSANHPGQPPAHTITQAQVIFHDLVDFFVDGGDLSDRLPSTVIRVIDDAVVVLRPGTVTIAE